MNQALYAHMTNKRKMKKKKIPLFQTSFLPNFSRKFIIRENKKKKEKTNQSYLKER
jgi:hypothetical protein